MRPVIIDTNAYTAFMHADQDIVEIIQLTETIAMSPVVLGELFAGFEGGNKAKKNRAELEEFLDSSRVKIYPITVDTAHFFSKIYMILKKKGRPIPTNDMWIAAQALEHGCVICTYDKHFSEIDGLLTATSPIDITF
ncbi:MAG: type II toxin-antitoxin system VapC family toxin [Parachlamydia sp.]|nr:type II toxin-antitoxin system VapC family toxin [Parachlamydia sp.]